MRSEASWSGLAWHSPGALDVHGHHVEIRGCRRAARPSSVRSRPRPLAAADSVELLNITSPTGRRRALAWRSIMSSIRCRSDLALKAQRRRSRRAHHEATAGAGDHAPSAVSAVSKARPSALAPRRARVLTQASAAVEKSAAERVLPFFRPVGLWAMTPTRSAAVGGRTFPTSFPARSLS